MKIKNFAQLATTEARQLALSIAEAGLEAIDTGKIIASTVTIEGNVLQVKNATVPLADIDRIHLISVGKCAGEAGATLAKVLGNRLTNGIILDVKPVPPVPQVTSFVGTHPLPSDANQKAAEAIVHSLQNLTERDLVLFAISGGGSTLLCLPEGQSCLEETLVLKTLMKAGAEIHEVNTVRKHLSRARGGFLARYAYPARVLSLIFSDVPGNNIEFVASGPTVRDTTTVAQAEEILERYDVFKTCNIEKCGLVETPKEEKYFAAVQNIVLVSNTTALSAMEAKARELGLEARLCNSCLTGEASDAGKTVANALQAESRRTALIYGGETTVNTKGNEGRGGRSLELGLSALRFLQKGELILTLASDGHDNGEFAGVICDTITRGDIEKAGLNIEVILQKHDTYPLFEKVGHYLLTGDTGSNVSDLTIALKT